MADSPSSPEDPLRTGADEAPAEHDPSTEIDTAHPAAQPPESPTPQPTESRDSQPVGAVAADPATGPADQSDTESATEADAADEDDAADAETPEEPAEEPERALFAGITALAPENAGPGAAAFFDIDNTIIKGSSFAALAKGMADRDYFTTAEVLEFTWKQLKYVVSGKENMDDIAQATENGLQFVKGREPSEIESLADAVYDEKMVSRLWADSVDLAAAHQALGHEVWLVSATPQEVAQVFAERLGLTGGLGTVAEVVDGRYTGRLAGVPLHGAAKAEVVRRIAEERGLDLARCAAYSDSSNDVPMLSLVGSPVAVNPDGQLRSYARENGWQIRDYRIRSKDAVRKGVPAAAAAGVVVAAGVGVAKVLRDRQGG